MTPSVHVGGGVADQTLYNTYGVSPNDFSDHTGVTGGDLC